LKPRAVVGRDCLGDHLQRVAAWRNWLAAWVTHASVRVMMIIFTVPRVRVAVMGLAPAGSGLAEQIVSGAAVRRGELVVDLGAGVGALTLPLLEAGAGVSRSVSLAALDESR
jgi:phospholipid N-methyltransferase